MHSNTDIYKVFGCGVYNGATCEVLSDSVANKCIVTRFMCDILLAIISVLQHLSFFARFGLNVVKKNVHVLGKKIVFCTAFYFSAYCP